MAITRSWVVHGFTLSELAGPGIGTGVERREGMATMAMPPYRWTFDRKAFEDAINAYEDGEIGALVMWAQHAADGLSYLSDLDEKVFGGPSRDALGYAPQDVDLAHMTWECHLDLRA